MVVFGQGPLTLIIVTSIVDIICKKPISINLQSFLFCELHCFVSNWMSYHAGLSGWLLRNIFQIFFYHSFINLSSQLKSNCGRVSSFVTKRSMSLHETQEQFQQTVNFVAVRPFFYMTMVCWRP